MKLYNSDGIRSLFMFPILQALHVSNCIWAELVCVSEVSMQIININESHT